MARKPTKAFINKLRKLLADTDRILADKWCDPGGHVPQFKAAGTLRQVRSEIRALITLLEAQQ